MPSFEFGYNRVYASIILSKSLGDLEKRTQLLDVIEQRARMKGHIHTSTSEEDALRMQQESAELKQLANKIVEDIIQSDSNIQKEIDEGVLQAADVIREACVQLSETLLVTIQSDTPDIVTITSHGPHAFSDWKKIEAYVNQLFPNSDLAYLTLNFVRTIE